MSFVDAGRYGPVSQVNGKITILIVGGYGTFGGRLVELIENEPRLTIMIGGRSLDKAKAFAEIRGAGEARLLPAGIAFHRAVGKERAQLTAAMIRHASLTH